MRRADQVLDPLQVEVTWREAKLMTLGERPREGETLGEMPRVETLGERPGSRRKSLVGDQGGDLRCDAEI